MHVCSTAGTNFRCWLRLLKKSDSERILVSLMTLGHGYFAQQVTDNEIDTTAIRRRPQP